VHRCGDHPCPPGGCHEEEKEPRLSRSPIGQAPSVAPPIVHEVIRSPGDPLPASLSTGMSAWFGQDFARVRVHSGPRAAESAASVAARAYTVGQHVVLGRSAPDLHSAAGQRLLAHELAHVIQQPAAVPAGDLPVSSPGDAGEREAATAATRVVPSSVRPSVQRDPDPQPGTGHNAAAEGGVDAEKWSEVLEWQYRNRGDTQRANAMRACRQFGGRACGIVLTNREMWRLYELAQDSGGDEAKVRAGLQAAVPSLALLGPVPSFSPGLPPGMPPVFTPPTSVPPITTPPVVTPNVPAPPAAAPAPSPSPVPGATAGLGVEGAVTIAGIAAIVAICVISAIQLWQLAKFQEELRRRGFIILDDPQAVCTQGCHLPARPPAGEIELPRLEPSKPDLDTLREWIEGQQGQPSPGQTQTPQRPAPEATPKEQPAPQATPAPAPQKPEQEKKKKTCATEYPDVRLCDSLPGGYSFRSPQAALAALKARTGDPSLRLVSDAPSTSGPCPGTGRHYGVKSGGKYVASISCCPCCQDSPTGPVRLTRCRII
jgi:hypothetical protein